MENVERSFREFFLQKEVGLLGDIVSIQCRLVGVGYDEYLSEIHDLLPRLVDAGYLAINNTPIDARVVRGLRFNEWY